MEICMQKHENDLTQPQTHEYGHLKHTDNRPHMQASNADVILAHFQAGCVHDNAVKKQLHEETYMLVHAWIMYIYVEVV